MAYTSGQSGVGWKEVFDRLKERIENGGLIAGSKLPAEAQLIKDLGASKMTVHRALRELAATGLVRRVERVGTFVAESVSVATARGRIGLFLPTNEGFLEIKLLSGIQEGMGSDHQLALYATDNDPMLEFEMLEKAVGEVDGILILSTCHPRVAKRLKEISDSGCPVLCIDREPTTIAMPSVTTDNYAVAKQGMEYLVRAGHRRIAYFGLWAHEMSSLAERNRAYNDAMRELGIQDPTALSRFIEARSSEEYFVEQRLFEDAIYHLTSGADPITAAFCVNEHYLSSLLEVCQTLPPALRARFEIVAFCDWPTLSFPSVRTHLIRQDAKTIGRAAAERLCRMMAGDTAMFGREEVPASFEPTASLIPHLGAGGDGSR